MTTRIRNPKQWRRELEAIAAGLVLSWDEPLAPRTTLRIGGNAECFAEIGTVAALRSLLHTVSLHQVPFFLLGQGSNVLVPDQGLPGVVVRLGGYFRRTRIVGDRVASGGAVSLARLARQTAKRGLRGLEALSGFPSTVGGAVFMNAGCYGSEIKDVLIRATVVDRQGGRRLITPSDLGAGYRSTILRDTGEIVVRASFQLSAGDAQAALERIQELNQRRWDSLPSGNPNAGSIFRNPTDDYAGRMIEAAGLKGEALGAALISERHANVIVNDGDARAVDVLALMQKARERVRDQFGVDLEPELVLAGSLRQAWDEAESSED